MPRYIDRESRRAEIMEATLEILSERGPRGVTFRAVADRMGGSSTLVTHYFSSRQALVDSLVEGLAEYPAQLDELEADAEDDRERLRRFLIWMVPSDDDKLMKERGRIKLLGESDDQITTRHIFEAWDADIRARFRDHVRELVPEERVAPVADLLRSVTNGITLSTIEQPDNWPPSRQLELIDEALSVLGLTATTPSLDRA